MLGNSKKIATFDVGHLLSENSAILGMRFENKEVVNQILEKLKTEVVGLNIRWENEHFVQNERPVQVQQLPKEKNMDLKELTQWATYHFKPDLTKACGTLAANDDTIIINVNHAVSDGKYIVGVSDHIGDPVKKVDNYLPVDFEEVFAEEMKERSKYPLDSFSRDPRLTRYSKMGMNIMNHEKVHEEIFDIKNLKCYNKEKKICHGLTPSIVAGFLLGVNALEGREVFDTLGGSMASNMRGEMKNKPTLNICNIFTVIPMGCEVTKYTTLSNAFNQLAASIKNLFKGKTGLYSFAHEKLDPFPKMHAPNGIMTCFSHLGPMNVMKPATDIYLYNINYRLPFSFAHPLLTYAIVDEKTGRNELHSQLRYECNAVTFKEADILNKTLRHFLETYDKNVTIGEAYKDIVAFQKSMK